MKEDVAFWRAEVDRGYEALTEIIGAYHWNKVRDIWNSGGASVAITTSTTRQIASPVQQSVFVNWIWAFGETFIPAVYWRSPHVMVTPKKSMYGQKAKLAEIEINAYMDLVNLRRTIQRELLDTLCFGIGWAKLGWFTQFGQVPKSEDVKTETRLSTTEYETFLNKNEPYVYRVSPYDVIVDPDATDISDAMWIAQEHYRLIDDIKRDPFYRFTDTGLTEYSYKTKEPEKMSVGMTHGKRKWGRILEIWDKKERKVYWLCDGSDRFNRVINWPYNKLPDFPFVPLKVSDSVDSFYPPSPVLPWLPLVEELSSIRTMRLDHLQRMVNKYIAPPGALSDDQKRDLLDPECELTEANNPDQIRELRGLQPDAQLYAAEDKVKADIREISGFSELLSGSVPYSDISATTSAIMQKNAAMRFRYASERVGEFITTCAKRLFEIVIQYQDYPKRASITGDAEPVEVEYTREEIEGEYYFSIDVEDMGVISQQQKVKNEYDTLVALSPYPEVKKWPMLRDTLIAFGKKDYEEYLTPEMGPPLDPNFENEMMAQAIPVRPNSKEDFQLHLKVHTDFMNSPMYMSAIQRVPQIAALFSEHIQMTLRMAEELQGQMGSGPSHPGKSSSLQRGSANVSSAPVGGARNTAGPSGHPLIQSLGNMVGG